MLALSPQAHAACHLGYASCEQHTLQLLTAAITWAVKWEHLGPIKVLFLFCLLQCLSVLGQVRQCLCTQNVVALAVLGKRGLPGPISRGHPSTPQLPRLMPRRREETKARGTLTAKGKALQVLSSAGPPTGSSARV